MGPHVESGSHCDTLPQRQNPKAVWHIILACLQIEQHSAAALQKIYNTFCLIEMLQ